MSELLSGLGDFVPYLKAAGWLVAVMAGMIAAAAGMYTLKTTFGPLLAVSHWMFAYRPGEKPNDIVAGISFGARMLAWAAVIAVAVWLLFS